MKKFFSNIVILFCVVTLSVNTAGAATGKNDLTWKQVYLVTILEAQKYAANSDYSKHDWKGKYPADLSGVQLADLNFDGIPELLLFGDGAGAAETLRIFALNKNGLKKIFQGWGNWEDRKLFRNKSDNTSAYSFPSENGNDVSFEGVIYLTNSKTRLNDDFANSAKIASFLVESKGDDQETQSATYTFNGRNVSEDEYKSLRDNLLSKYEEIPYEYAEVRVLGVDAVLTEKDFLAFLDSYKSER
jgi:hypothetical protein